MLLRWTIEFYGDFEFFCIILVNLSLLWTSTSDPFNVGYNGSIKFLGTQDEKYKSLFAWDH